MTTAQHAPSSLSSSYVHTFLSLFSHSKRHLQSLVSSNNEEDCKLLVSLHYLMEQLQHFFDEPAEPNSGLEMKQRDAQYALEMEVIMEGGEEKEMSSTTLKGERRKDIPKVVSKHSASFSSPKHCSKGSNDSLNQPECMYTPPEKVLELDETIEKYQDAIKTISSLTFHKSRLEQRLAEMNNKLAYIQKEKEGLVSEKKECLNLLVKHTEKSDKLGTQNTIIREALGSCEQRVEALEEELKEKSELLDEIQEYLREEGVEEHRVTFKPSTFAKQAVYNLDVSHLEDENERLNMEVEKLNEEIEIMNQQNIALKQEFDQMQASMDSLLRDNEEFYNQVEQLKKEINIQHNKNRELVKIQEGKRLNDLVHKQNKHLLQVNYELSNRIFGMETQINRMNDQFRRLESRNPTQEQNSLERTHKSKLNITSEDTMNYTPKAKLSFKASTGDKFFQHMNASRGRVEDIEKSRLLEQSLRVEREKNKELEDRVQELICEMAMYERELVERKKEIQRLNFSLGNGAEKASIFKKVGVEDESADIEISKLSVQLQNHDHNQTNEEQFMSIQEFTQRFEPSPMDVLFVMLRMSEICQSMIEAGASYPLSPTNVFLALDDPDQPEKILVKIEKQHSSRQTLLFLSPQSILGQQAGESALVWNMGMLFHFLLYKTPYFNDVEQLIDEEENIVLSKIKFPEVERIIEGMVRREPEERLAIGDLLEMIAAEINKMLEEEQA